MKILISLAILLGITNVSLAVECDVNADKQQCCSAKNCGGKVLNNRDLHNCKLSDGKSWHPAAQNGHPAECYKT